MLHRRCEANEQILRAVILDSKVRADSVAASHLSRINDLEEQLGELHSLLLHRAAEAHDRERDLTDRLLAFANPAGFAVSARLRTPAPAAPTIPRGSTVTAPGLRAVLTPAQTGFAPTPEARRVMVVARAKQAAEVAAAAEEIPAAESTLPTIAEHLAADADAHEAREA